MTPRAAGLALLLALLATARAGAAPEGRVELAAPETVNGLMLQDVDGDGAEDVVVLGDRRVQVFAGRTDGLPRPEPRFTVALPPDVTFVDVLPPSAEGPGLLALGTAGVRRLALQGGGNSTYAGLDDTLTWSDFLQANLVDLAKPDGSILVPTRDGWRRLGPGGRVVDLPVEQLQSVEAAGAFLQDTAVVTHARPQVWLADLDGTPTLWALGGNTLRARVGEKVVTYDTSFLPRTGTRTLVDLTGDGIPDIVHADGTNRESTYAIFRTPPPPSGAATRGADLRPPAAVLRLSGYCLDPAYVDLDADGYRDFVITTIPIDGRNTARALGGQVSANTRAFLNRLGSSSERLYPGAPDASVVSDIGVQIRYSPTGNIDIQRSFTILVDGDVDGDGRKDLVIRTGPEALTIRRGTAEGVWEAEGREVGIPPMGDSPNVEGFTADVTGDGRDEVVLLYRKPFAGRDRLWVLAP